MPKYYFVRLIPHMSTETSVLLDWEMQGEEDFPTRFAGSWWQLAWQREGGNGWTKVDIPYFHTRYHVKNLEPRSNYEFFLRLSFSDDSGDHVWDPAHCRVQTVGLPVAPQPAKLAAV